MTPDPSKYTHMTALNVRCGAVMVRDPSQRLGQAYYNAARELFGDHINDTIDGTILDPFNNDRAVPAYLYAISKKVGERERDVRD